MIDNTFSNITELKTIKDVFDYIFLKDPDWIVCTLDKYSSDYPNLQNNWKTICDVTKNTMKKIIIVESFVNDDQYMYAELLSKVGFVVRTKYDLTKCNVCNSAIPTEFTYNKIKESNVKVPDFWFSKCKNC